MKPRFAALAGVAAFLAATSCGEASERSVEDEFFAARNAKCQKYGSVDGYSPIDLASVRHILQSRYEGERLMAHLSPEHHCATAKTVGERTCYRFIASAIHVGGGLAFCADRDGAISDVEIGE
ncbi:hypothetical protein [Erythrobacter sp.]|uniref:hypothetical protein n=1 Tax=Erythrobacter sp. TaxID=1042 RepID=UPI0025EB8D44|nr:hypothetical protein [Erythrobacter sp.]